MLADPEEAFAARNAIASKLGLPPLTMAEFLVDRERMEEVSASFEQGVGLPVVWDINTEVVPCLGKGDWEIQSSVTTTNGVFPVTTKYTPEKSETGEINHKSYLLSHMDAVYACIERPYDEFRENKEKP